MDIEKIKSELPIIKDMVADNLHTEAIARIAHITGKAKHEQLFNLISSLQSIHGYAPATLLNYRDQNAKVMFEQIEHKHGDEIATSLKGAL